MTYNLFIDDIREPHWSECVASGVNQELRWIVVKSSREAVDVVKLRGMPARLALDHDLGFDIYSSTRMVDTVPRFLNWLARVYWNGTDPVPEYTIHSANPEGAENMRAFMESWKKSAIQDNK